MRNLRAMSKAVSNAWMELLNYVSKEKRASARLTEKDYREKIIPGLKELSVPPIVSALGVCMPSAADIRKGTRIPHRRHWLKLARLARLL
jgi:hypothetical protein